MCPKLVQLTRNDYNGRYNNIVREQGGDDAHNGRLPLGLLNFSSHYFVGHRTVVKEVQKTMKFRTVLGIREKYDYNDKFSLSFNSHKHRSFDGHLVRGKNFKQ